MKKFIHIFKNTDPIEVGGGIKGGMRIMPNGEMPEKVIDVTDAPEEDVKKIKEKKDKKTIDKYPDVVDRKKST